MPLVGSIQVVYQAAATQELLQHLDLKVSSYDEVQTTRVLSPLGFCNKLTTLVYKQTFLQQ